MLSRKDMSRPKQLQISQQIGNKLCLGTNIVSVIQAVLLGPNLTATSWKTNAFPLYRASLSLNRFWQISRFIRFDNVNTRSEHLRSDKAAAISDIFEMLNSNLRKNYVPSDCVTVEQLFPYKGKARFTQYMPSKPAKYGLKVWWVCDSQNYYPITGQIYAGKSASGRETNQGERVLKDLCYHFKNTGRNQSLTIFSQLYHQQGC